MRTVVYFQSILHNCDAAGNTAFKKPNVYKSAAENSPRQMQYLVLFEKLRKVRKNCETVGFGLVDNRKNIE